MYLVNLKRIIPHLVERRLNPSREAMRTIEVEAEVGERGRTCHERSGSSVMLPPPFDDGASTR